MPPLTGPLGDLVAQLKEQFNKDEKPIEPVREILRKYIESGADDWKQYALFNKHKYARNLIEINENFELLLLCWEPGQVRKARALPFDCFCIC